MATFEVGSWYESQGIVYVHINRQGTVRKFHEVKWYKILALFFLQLIEKKKHLQEVLEFLN
jgi:hypothetical protein